MTKSTSSGSVSPVTASMPGEPIGKSGTAEYGSGDPPPTHAWFIAERDGLAVALDLARVSFLDSAGIRAIERGVRRILVDARSFVIVAPG